MFHFLSVLILQPCRTVRRRLLPQSGVSLTRTVFTVSGIVLPLFAGQTILFCLLNTGGTSQWSITR